MKGIKKLLLFIFIFQFVNVQEKREFYRCGIDDFKVIPKPVTNFVQIYKDKRRLNGQEFKDFNIYLDLINIKKGIIKYNLSQYEDLFINSLNKAVKTLESLLKVKNLEYGFRYFDENISAIPIEDWNKTLIGTNAIGNSKDLGIDLFIFGSLSNQMGTSTLASAGAYYIDPYTAQPRVGIVNINANVDYSKMHSQEYFQSIIIHEFTHILGFSDWYFYNVMHNIFSRVDDYNITRYYINSSKVVEVARKYYNCSEIDGVELEESGGGGTAGSHWEARILLGDYMNGVIYPEEQVISEFTLALLEDTGYFKANYYTGGLMRYGKNKGCDFVKKRCVNEDHEINPDFENEFYDSMASIYPMEASCSSGRQSRTYYAWYNYSNGIPENYRYFADPFIGGFAPADYCPVAREYYPETLNSYYTGHCSLKGNGGYGTQIYYQRSETVPFNSTHLVTRTYTYSNRSEELESLTGETYSDHSFCYQSTLVKNNTHNNNLNSVRAVCYESFCSNRSLTIKINDDYIICPRTGGKIEVEGYIGFFLCPDYNLICSGTVMCNDMFDCVDKKSEIKNESYIYEYKSKTSQNTENILIVTADEISNFELSENGICPINCKHCQTNNKCLKCRNDYGLLGSKQNEEIKCLSLDILNIGYYHENNIYYKCMDNCDICFNDSSCNTCSTGFDYYNGQCIQRIENCEIYLNVGSCNRCKDNFAFKEDNRSICLNINNFTNYYSKDDGISYYPCGKNISNCTNCYYDKNDTQIKCYLCQTNYALSLDENICLSKENLSKIYYYINVTHINKCSNIIDNCNECENNNTCSKCKNDFYMINDDTENCINVSEIPLDEYYLNENGTMYYSCNDSIYQDVNNCKLCSSKTNCTFCQDNFTFIEGNKSICIDKEELKDKYIKDPLDNSNFIKCENKYNNCYRCNATLCLSCKEESVFINDNYSKCELKSLLNMDDYFTHDNITYYFCKDNRYKDREECQKIIHENTEIYMTQYATEISTYSLSDFSTYIPIKSTNIDFTDYKTEFESSSIVDNFTDFPTDTPIKSTEFISEETIDISINSVSNGNHEDLTDTTKNSIYNNFTEYPDETSIYSTDYDPIEDTTEISKDTTAFSFTDYLKESNTYYKNNTFIEYSTINDFTQDTSNILLKSTNFEETTEVNDSILYSTELSISTSYYDSTKETNINLTEYPTEVSLNSTILNSFEETYDNPLNSSLIINPSQDITESIKSTNLNLLNTSIITYNSFTVNPLGYTTDSLTNSTYLNSVINPTEAPTNSLSTSHVINNPFFELFILQVRIINGVLKIYVIISIKIKSPTYFRILIDSYKYNNLRSLQDSTPNSHEIDLYINENGEMEPGKIYELTSQEKFDKSDRVVVNLKSNSDYEMKVLNNNDKILDSQENEKMIGNGEIFDLSNNPSDYQVNNYIIESSSMGCNFNLISKTTIKENNQKVSLNFTEKDNTNNNINIKCILSSEYNNKIPCSLNQNINKNFTLDSYAGTSDNGIYCITQENTVQNLQLNCLTESRKKSESSNQTLIVILLIIGVLFIGVAIILIIMCCKKKQEHPIDSNQDKIKFAYGDNSDHIINNSNQ